jgi:hypothetical protein
MQDRHPPPPSRRTASHLPTGLNAISAYHRHTPFQTRCGSIANAFNTIVKLPSAQGSC